MTDTTNSQDALQVGDRVRVLWQKLPDSFKYDWMGADGEGVEGWIAGIRYCPINGLNYTFADNADMTGRADGFAAEQLEKIKAQASAL